MTDKCDGVLVWFGTTMPPNENGEPRDGAVLECGCGYYQCAGNFFHESHNGNEILREGLA